MKRPYIDGEKVRDRAKRGAILFAVAAFLIGSVGIYIFVFFMDNQTQDPTQQSIEQQLQEAQKQQEEERKNMPVDANFKVDEPVTALKTQDITVGTGAEAKAESTVKVTYKGGLAKTGQIFDQGTTEFPLQNLIAGWKEGIPGMKVGGKRKLFIPYDKGYGSAGNPAGGIPAASDLIFEVELLEVK